MALHPSHISLTELRYFVALAEIGHFGHAASHCNVSQPTLSAGLKKMEDNLDVQLFERGNRLLGMTEAGRRLLPRARRVLAEAEELVEAAAMEGDRMRGSLRLGVIPTIAPDLLPWMVPLMDHEEPELRLIWHEDRTSDLLLALAEFRLDAAILALPVSMDGLDSAPLYYEEFRLVTAADSKIPSASQLHVDELLGMPLLLLTEGHCLRDQALELCGAQAQEDPVSDYRATSLDTLLQLVRTGRGMTLLPALTAERARGLGIRQISFHDPVPGRDIALIWRKSSPRQLAFRELSRLLRERHPRAPGIQSG